MKRLASITMALFLGAASVLAVSSQSQAIPAQEYRYQRPDYGNNFYGRQDYSKYPRERYYPRRYYRGPYRYRGTERRPYYPYYPKPRPLPYPNPYYR